MYKGDYVNINLILEGGGALGVTYIGCYKALLEKGYIIKRCAGTSVGSLMAALIVAGYTPGEIENIFFGEEFSVFLKSSGLGRKIPPYKALNLFLHKGIYDSSIIERFVDTLLERKGIKTFGDIVKRGKNKLTIIAADVTNRRMVVMPNDLEKYSLDPLSFKVSTAVSMSCAIPLFFTPVILDNNDMQNYIVDGGLLGNFPVWVFDIENEKRNLTYAIKIDEKPSNTSMGRDDIFSYALDVLNTPLNDDRIVYVRKKEMLKIITIKNEHLIRATEFYKLKDYRDYLRNLGYDSVVDYLEKNQAISK